MKRSHLVLMLTAITIFTFVTVSHGQYTIIQLTNNDYDDEDARINNNGDVVWYGKDALADKFDIYFYD